MRISSSTSEARGSLGVEASPDELGRRFVINLVHVCDVLKLALGGYCKLPDFAWGDWGVGQVERVWDLMDISLLRSAKKGVDPSYKT